MIADFFNGKFGLARTFWYGIFGVLVGCELLWRILLPIYMSAESDQTIEWLYTFNTALMLCFPVCFALMLRAVWKAGADRPYRKFWGWIALFVTLLYLIYSAFGAISYMWPEIGTPRFIVRADVRGINQQLPQDVGGGYWLQRVDLVGDDLSYLYSASFSVAELDRDDMVNELGLDTADGQALCRDMQSYFRGGIRQIIYEFSYTDDVIRAVLTAEECFDWLSR